MDRKRPSNATTYVLMTGPATAAAFVLSVAAFFWFGFTYYLLPALLAGLEVLMR